MQLTKMRMGTAWSRDTAKGLMERVLGGEGERVDREREGG